MVLQEQGRYDMAEQELRQHLVVDPNDGFSHALLAIALLEQEKRDEAEQAARDAIGNTPDLAFAHYALARVLLDRNLDNDAAVAIEEAIRLEPTDADYHAMRANIDFQRRRWALALSAAETGLQFNPEHNGCNNLRAMALVKLGRKSEAGITIERTLSRNPDDAFSHANQGWTLLEQGRRKEAMNHFRESLRLDPTNDWARAGLLEGLKAGNPIYAVMLKYFLWMQKLPDGARWGIIIGGYFANRVMSGLAKSNPNLANWLLPFQILYAVFAILTWLAYPLFNLMLFLHPVGRHALDREQKMQASWVGLCFGLGLASLGIFFATHNGAFLISALVFGLLTLPTSAIFACAHGWPRMAMLTLTLGLAVVGLTAVALTFINPPADSSSGKLGGGALGLFITGAIISQWVAIALTNQRPRR